MKKRVLFGLVLFLGICFARDPFFLNSKKKTRRMALSEECSLLGIIEGETKKSALVLLNGESEVLHEGTKIGPYTVLKICKKTVALERDGNRSILRIKK